MIFLNPAVLFGLLAASIPVLIHLLNLRRLKRIEFSTLAFLKELQKNKIRKIKLKQWLLLALRVLIILLIVTAFARPTLKGLAIGGTTSAAKTSAVFILDNTFSMSVIDANGSYLNQAKSTAKKLLKQLQEGDEAALILVSDRSANKVKFTNNLSELSKSIDAVNASFSSGTLNNSIVKAAKLLSGSKNFNKEIYILSDFQYGRLVDKDSYSNLGQLLNDKIRLYTFNYSGKEVFNIGIDELKLNTQIFEKDKPINFSITVSNYSNRDVNNEVVSLFVNGQRSAQQSIILKAGESKILTMDAVVKATGHIDALAEIEDDDILQDNKRYTHLFIPEKIPAILFTDNRQDSRFVKLALSASNGEGTLIITQKNLDQIASYDLSQYDVVIIIGSESLKNTEQLNSYLDDGGSLMLMPGAKSTLTQIQHITKGLNLPQPTGTIGRLNDPNNPVSFDKIDFDHPVFQNIFSKSQKKSVESPEIYYHFKQNSAGRGRDIITLMDGSSFLSEYKIGNGKIFLLNTAPVLSWSNFPLKSIFAPFFNKSIYYLASKENISDEFLAGTKAAVKIGFIASSQIKIVRPDNTEEYLNLDNYQNNIILYTKTDIAGNYKIYSGGKLIKEFSINTDPRESVVKYLSDKDFENYLKEINFKGKWIPVSPSGDIAKIVMQARFGSELWKYFLLLALIIALIEMGIAKNAKKELTKV